MVLAERPAGGEAPAHVLECDDVSVAREEPGGLYEALTVLAVGGSLEKHRELLRDGHAPYRRAIDVGRERGPVPGRNLHVGLNDDVIQLRTRLRRKSR